MKKTGIWIDKRQAKIFRLESDGTTNFQIIASGVEERKPTGGAGTAGKGGPQDVVHDRKFTEREQHQLRRFFAQLAELVQGSSKVVILGPGQTGQQLAQDWKTQHTDLATRIQGVEKADSMTDNQLKAWLIAYFGQTPA